MWNHDQLIQRNLIACNRDAQVWGWFDMKDNRHWPAGKAADAKSAEANAGAKPGDIAAAYVAKDNEASPQGLSLEKLRLRFIENVYFASPGQKWFEWGVTWGKHESYSSLTEFQAALGIDTRSRALEPGICRPRRPRLPFKFGNDVSDRAKLPTGANPGCAAGRPPTLNSQQRLCG